MIESKRGHFSEKPMEELGNSQLHMTSWQVAKTHRIVGGLGASDRGIHQVQDSWHYPPLLCAVEWR